MLRLYATRSRAASVTLYATSNSWTEGTITWNTAPAEGERIGTVVMGPENQWYEWDVTSYLKGKEGQVVSFVLYDNDNANQTIRFSSEEDDNRPELKILHDG